MPREKTVVLGGQEYQISQLPMRLNKEWRDSVGAPVLGLVQLVQDNADLELNAESLRKIVGIVKDLLLGSMDLLLDALFRYSPLLAADRERIENESYDDEAITALGVCVSLAYPLDMALTGLRGGGLPVTPISTNSYSRNMANGTKKHTADRPRSTSKT